MELTAELLLRAVLVKAPVGLNSFAFSDADFIGDDIGGFFHQRVIAGNREFDADTAQALGDLFVECIAAPSFTPEAREILAKRKNCRLLQMPNLEIEPC